MSSRLARAWALGCAALLLGAPAAAAAPRKRAAAPAARPRQARKPTLQLFGEVSSVTADAAFLNRGSADGLTAGQALTFSRGAKVGGACTVSAVSEHFARCEGRGLRVGDRFPVGRGPELNPTGPAELPTEGELSRRAQSVEAAGFTLRDFDGAAARGSGVGPRVEALLSHTSYLGAQTGPYSVQRLDVLLYDVELFKGLRVSADVTALNFSARPTESRAFYAQTPVLLVRQLELSFRRADVPFSASLGRTWLRASTGFLVVDGGQAAWRFGEGLEVGAYGGLLPDAARLTLAPSQWAAGAYGRVRFSSAGKGATLVQLAVRAGWAQRDLLGGRAEVGLAASLWKGAEVDAHAAVELGFGQTMAQGVDAARLGVGWRPTERVRFNLDARYRGLPLTGLVEVGTVSPGQRALHGDLGATFELSPWLFLGLQGGVATDFSSGLLQVRGGPELSVPRIAGLPLGLSVGYLEEAGWLRGRHGYLQLSASASTFLRILTRASWFQQQQTDASAGLSGHELGASVALEVVPWRYLKARVLVMGRLPLAAQASPLGSIGGQLAGSF